MAPEDYRRELNLPLRREGEATDLIYAPLFMVNAAAAAHVQSVDGVWPNFQDIEGLRKFALQARRLGFSGMSLIHPAQIEHVNKRSHRPRKKLIIASEWSSLLTMRRRAAKAPLRSVANSSIKRSWISARQTLALAESLGS